MKDIEAQNQGTIEVLWTESRLFDAFNDEIYLTAQRIEWEKLCAAVILWMLTFIDYHICFDDYLKAGMLYEPKRKF